VKRWFVISTAVVTFAGGVLAAIPAAAQTSGTYTPPRTREGQPDLQGIWQALNTAAWDIQDHGASFGVPAGRGVVEVALVRSDHLDVVGRAEVRVAFAEAAGELPSSEAWALGWATEQPNLAHHLQRS